MFVLVYRVRRSDCTLVYQSSLGHTNLPQLEFGSKRNVFYAVAGNLREKNPWLGSIQIIWMGQAAVLTQSIFYSVIWNRFFLRKGKGTVVISSLSFEHTKIVD